MKKDNDTHNDISRRDFLKGGSFGALAAMVGGLATQQISPIQAAEPETVKKPVGPPVRYGVIGCGDRGREMVETLSQLPNAPVVAVCDHYAPYVRKAKRLVETAEGYEDYRELLKNPEVEAVIVATPTPTHRQIALEAIQANKHVYCEAPLAGSIDDARAIALAARANPRINFQSGLQARSDPQRHFLITFIRTGAMGRNVMARSQWHKKQSWRRIAPTPQRERELNWRLYEETSTGLAGEIGIHQFDAASWVLRNRPVAITGHGGTLLWNDEREVPDTIQTVVEYPGGVNFVYDCTIANSFDGDYEMYYGSYAALMVRGNKAWMFKEVDSPMLGWEVYARKDRFYEETGIALVANATKLTAQGDNPVEESPFSNTPLYYALEAFTHNCGVIRGGVEDFSSFFDASNTDALRDYLKDLNTSLMPGATYQEGFEATVTAIKAHEAIRDHKRIELKEEWYRLS